MKDALQIDTTCKDLEGELADLAELGFIYEENRDLEAAIKIRQEALRKAQENRRTFGEIKIFSHLAECYRRDSANQVKYSDEALRIAKEVGYNLELSKILNDRGLMCASMGQFDRGEACIEDAFKIAVPNGIMKMQDRSLF